MRVNSAAQVQMLPLPAAFRHVQQPCYSGTDFPYIFGSWNQSPPESADDAATVANIVANPDAECVHLRQVFVPHWPTSSQRSSQESNDTGYPSLTWTHGDASLTYVANRPGMGHTWSYTTSDSKTYYLFYERMEPHNGRIAIAEVSADTASANVARYAHASGSWQGFQWYFRMIASPGTRAYMDFLVALDGTSPHRWVRVRWSVGEEPTLALTTATLSQITGEYSGGSSLRWDVVQRLEVGSDFWSNVGGDDRFSSLVPANYHYVGFEVLAQRLFVRLEGMQKPLVVPADGHVGIAYALVAYRNFVDVSWHGAPVKYVSTGTWESADHALGFMPLTAPTLYVHEAGSPTGTSAVAQLLDPSTARYKLTLSATPEGSLNGRSYAPATPAVRAVTYSYASVESGAATSPVWLYPDSIAITHQFDYNTLTIVSRAVLGFQNMYGEWADFNALTGQWGIAIDLASDYYPPARQFAGIAHRRGDIVGDGTTTRFTMHCVDRSVQLRNPRWNLPWMDGWNIYYAMAFLAQLGGIAIQDLAFAPYVPHNPYVDYGDPEGGGAWFLPVGHAGTPLTRFSGQELWSIMVRLAYAIGYLLFFDANGKLQFRKFRIPGGVRRTFYESDTGGPNGCWNLMVSRDMEDVRNTITVVGVDAFGPLWNPIVAHRQDDASIHYPFAPNYIGWEQPLVWSDSQFANLSFASAAADALFAFLRHPGEVVQLTTWLQPDLYPLDVIAIEALRFGTMSKRYLVVGIEHRVHSGALGETTIVARYIPE